MRKMEEVYQNASSILFKLLQKFTDPARVNMRAYHQMNIDSQF